jgi:hypothetical protein
LFGSIKSAEAWSWGPLLGGHVDKCLRKAGADRIYDGALTEDPHTPFHSCDSRGICPVRDGANVVQIIPVTTRERTSGAQSNVADEVVASHPYRAIEPTASGNSSLKRVLDEPASREDSPKRMRETVMKEPGHTLLTPQQNWWVREGSNERPPLLSSDGEELSYYLVRRFVEPADTLESSTVTSLLSERAKRFGWPRETQRHLSLR